MFIAYTDIYFTRTLCVFINKYILYIYTQLINCNKIFANTTSSFHQYTVNMGNT